MFHTVRHSKVKIIYTDRELGNLELRFGNKDKINQRLNKLKDKINKPKIAHINPLGGDEFIDLINRKLSKGWNKFNCDGLITDRTDTALTLFPADCIPLVISLTGNSLIALLHINRKNAEKSFHINALSYIVEKYHADIKNLNFYLGPSIKQRSYYFSDIEQAQKTDIGWERFIKFTNNNYYIDLQGYTIDKLLSCGVSKTQIISSEVDTGSSPLFFSHRRSQQVGDIEGRNGFAVFSELN